VLPHLRARGAGHIVQISSVGGLGGFPTTGIYGASKFALEGMSEALALEAAAFGIRVTIVQQGGYWTDLYTRMCTNGAAPGLCRLPGRRRAAVGGGLPRQLAAGTLMKLIDHEDPPPRLLLGSTSASQCLTALFCPVLRRDDRPGSRAPAPVRPAPPHPPPREDTQMALRQLRERARQAPLARYPFSPAMHVRWYLQ
jgi:hypothetical protein